MKKLIIISFILICSVLATSCAVYTCPTYYTKEAPMEKKNGEKDQFI